MTHLCLPSPAGTCPPLGPDRHRPAGSARALFMRGNRSRRSNGCGAGMQDRLASVSLCYAGLSLAHMRRRRTHRAAAAIRKPKRADNSDRTHYSLPLSPCRSRRSFLSSDIHIWNIVIFSFKPLLAFIDLILLSDDIR